jgi:hypothetical protein
VDPDFDGKVLLPATLQVLAGLLQPVPQDKTETPRLDTETNAAESSGDRS